jgi:hypothetical protein
VDGSTREPAGAARPSHSPAFTVLNLLRTAMTSSPEPPSLKPHTPSERPSSENPKAPLIPDSSIFYVARGTILTCTFVLSAASGRP